MANFGILNHSNQIGTVIVAEDLETAKEAAIKSGIGIDAVELVDELMVDGEMPTYFWVWDGVKFNKPTIIESE
jgi:hypothetical protein